MPVPKVGLIGAGGISAVHAEAWRSLGAHVQVHALSGAEQLAEEYGFTAVDSLDGVLDHADIVDIVTPSSTHAALASAAIAAGVHVICEKPLAPDARQAQDVVDAADAAGVRLFPAHVVRYFGEYAAIKDRIDAGVVGRVATQRFSRAGAAPESPWFFDESRGGGLIRDLMIHDLDQALWFAGPVTSVYATQNPPTVDDVVPCPVVALVVLTHANGVISSVQSAWLAPGMPFRVSVEVSGSTGRLSYSSAGDAALTVDTVAVGPEGYLPPLTSGPTPYELEIRDFLEAIRTGAPARVTPADAVEAVALADAAYASLAAGAPITVAEVSR